MSHVSAFENTRPNGGSIHLVKNEIKEFKLLNFKLLNDDEFCIQVRARSSVVLKNELVC